VCGGFVYARPSLDTSGFVDIDGLHGPLSTTSRRPVTDDMTSGRNRVYDSNRSSSGNYARGKRGYSDYC